MIRRVMNYGSDDQSINKPRQLDRNNKWLSLVDFPKQVWALRCMIACRLRMALTASFATETSMSWATALHALDLSFLIGLDWL
ncbi:hypothetical protein Tco_1560470 [Tanacetum coccineum]